MTLDEDWNKCYRLLCTVAHKSDLHALELYVPVAEHLAVCVAVLDKLVQLFGVLLAGHQQAVQQARH